MIRSEFRESIAAISSAIDRSGMFELLTDLVRTPSHYGIERQEEAVAAVLADYLSSHGLPAERVEVAPGRPNVLSHVRGKRPGRHLLFNGHTDTVPLNSEDPGVGFSPKIRDGMMFGRGTVDMKGAIAAMAAALVALRETKSLDAGAVTLAAVVDEERESIGTEHLVRSGFIADGAIVGEPTGNRIALGHKGLEWLEIEFTGRSAHGGTPQAGVNAIVAASRFVCLAQETLPPRLLARRHPLLGPPTLNFGTIRGGDQPSIVAGRCLLTADRRTVPGETADVVFAELTQLLRRVEHEIPGLSTSIRRMPGGMATMEHGACITDPDHLLARAVTAACELVLEAPQQYTVFPAWTDAALLAAFGHIPSVVLGPGDLSVSHSPVEAVPINEVRQAALIYAACALLFCSPL